MNTGIACRKWEAAAEQPALASDPSPSDPVELDGRDMGPVEDTFLAS